MSREWSPKDLADRANAMLALGLLAMAAAVLAGWSVHGWPGLVLAAAGLGASRVLAKPWLVTRFRQPGGPARLAGEMTGQGLLALALFGAGTVGFVLTGVAAPAPLLLPPTLVLAAAIASSMIWKPLPPEFDQLIDTMTEGLTRRAALSDLSPEYGDALDAALDALPVAGAPQPAIWSALAPHVGVMTSDLLAARLINRAAQLRTDRDLRAAAIALTDMTLVRERKGQGDLRTLFDLVRADGSVSVVGCYAMQADALLDFIPEAAHEMPAPEMLETLARSVGRGVGDRLVELAARVADLRATSAR